MSRANTRYIATVAFSVGIAMIMNKHYRELEGRKNIKNKISKLYHVSDEIIGNHPEKISAKEGKKIEDAVVKMNEHGLENASSYQTYIAFLIALISERITELQRKKGSKKKTDNLEKILKLLEPMYVYFEQRTRNKGFDEDATKLLNNFNLIF